jgi:hypothetical protein
MTTFLDVIYEIIKYPISLDPNYNKGLYHVYMGAKLMGYFELLLFTYQQDVFIKHLNELFRLLIQNRLLIDEFKTLEPVFIIAIKFIRTNPIMFPEQTDAFQLTRKIMDIAPQLIYH